MSRWIWTIVFIIGITGMTSAQDSTGLVMTLEEAIATARIQSPDALNAKNKLLQAYWRNRTFRADFLPNLTLDATLPDLANQATSQIQDDGSITFINTSNINSSLSLSASQNIGLTGGSVFVRSSLQRIDDLTGAAQNTSYLSTPVSIGFMQPLFSFNSLRWSKKVEPLLYQEAKRQYLEEMEAVSVRTTNLFFSLLISQINQQISQKNLANNDTLYKIAQGRYNLGKIAENELLQMELSLLRSQTAVAQSELDVRSSNFDLRAFLGYTENVNITALPPNDIPDVEVSIGIAVEQARLNRKKAIEMERQLIEADREVARARGENGFNADLFASYGLAKRAPTFDSVYLDPRDQQGLNVGISVPILDWGKSKSQVRMAEANRDLVRTTVEQDNLSFEQEVYLKVAQFNILKNQTLIAAKSDTIAQKRYFVAKERYMIGKIDITELNIALEEKDVAKRSYFQNLRTYWSEYYNIRRLTLYDFQRDQVIEFVNPF